MDPDSSSDEGVEILDEYIMELNRVVKAFASKQTRKALWKTRR